MSEKVNDMSLTCSEWLNQRVRLQEKLIAAALNLQEYMGVESFQIPMKNKTGTPLQICLGQVTSSVEEMENELAELSVKLYESKHQKVVEVEVFQTEPHLFVTISPDQLPSEDALEIAPA
ncbi:MAG: hypothetical protein V4628_18340 [Pseudomonadota bacterium]